MMAGYKAPMARSATRTKVKAAFMDWLDENLGSTDETLGIWDDADDEAARKYDDSIEDGQSHKDAIAEAKTRFYESLKESLASLLPDAFDGLGE